MYKRQLENITYELKGLGACRPILLSGRILEKVGSLKKVINAIVSTGMEPGAIFTDIPADSSVEVVNRIGKTYKEADCDSIIEMCIRDRNGPPDIRLLTATVTLVLWTVTARLPCVTRRHGSARFPWR